MSIQWIAIICILIIVCLGIAAIYGSYRWQLDTDKLRARLTGGRQTIKPLIYDPKEIEDLPAPVQRFFKKVLKDGRAIVAAVKLSQHNNQSKIVERSVLSAVSRKLYCTFFV